MPKNPSTGAKAPSVSSIIKRDGSIVPFNAAKIMIAVEKAMKEAGEFKEEAPAKIAVAITSKLIAKRAADPDFTPTVEGMQDLVEAELMLQKFPASAKGYILYRQEHEKLREETATVSDEVRDLVTESKQYFRCT